jgi:hypothetical protein
MYPADLLGSTYSANDLPDAVTVNWTDRFTGSMSKSGSGYAGGGATLQIVNGIWRLSDSDGNRRVGRCLIRGDGNLTQGDDLVEDQFADCYKLSFTFFGPTDVIVLRNRLCAWETANINAGAGERDFEWYGGLYYRETNFFGDEISPSWIVFLDQEFYNPETDSFEYQGGVVSEKYTNLGTPIGTWDSDIFTLVTVTEC